MHIRSKFNAYALASALALGGIAHAQKAPPSAPPGPPPGGPGGPARFMEADANADGKVSLEEATAKLPGMNAERFKRMDTNADGFLTRDDRRPGGPGGEGGPGGRGDRMVRFLEADKDGDGKVSYEEAAAQRPGFPRENFDRMDSNHDGFVSKEDAPPPGGPGGPGGLGGERRGEMMRRLMEADANTDGKVSLEEAKTAMPNMDSEAFARFDRNGDGFIAPDDRPANRPGGPPPAPSSTPPPPAKTN